MRKLAAFAIGAAATMLGACDSTTGGNTGTLTLRMTDAPFPFSSVSRVDVFIVRVDARTGTTTDAEATNEADMSNWTTVASPNAAINLLDLNGGKTTNLGQATLPTGTWNGFRLIIDPSKSSVTLTDGSHPSIVWPSASKTGIKVVLDAPVSLTANGSVMVLDFDVGRSFVMRGNDIRNNGLLFKPVIRATATDITGSASGTVHSTSATGPIVAGATVEVLKAGTAVDDADDTNIIASTVTDANGAFTFAFLLPGTYALRATAPSGSTLKPALLTGGFTVSTGQTTSGLTVVLSP